MFYSMILNIPCYREIFSNTAAMHSAQRNLQNEWSTNIVAQKEVDFQIFGAHISNI